MMECYWCQQILEGKIGVPNPMNVNPFCKEHRDLLFKIGIQASLCRMRCISKQQYQDLWEKTLQEGVLIADNQQELLV